jgi:hypothetical protein
VLYSPDLLYSKWKFSVSSKVRGIAANAAYEWQKKGNAFGIPVFLRGVIQCFTAPTASLVSTFGIATGSVFSGSGSGARSRANSST